jgi:NADH-quinone oxidoreductase subunit L
MVPILSWSILLLPLLAVLGIVGFALRRAAWAAGLSIGAVVLAFGASVALYRLGPQEEIRLTWLAVGQLHVDLALKLDSLSLLMLLVVTGVASAIHIYSAGYMQGDRGYGRYYAGLSLFTFSMLGIVLSGNFLQLFIFWELVGVSSYLLIGFWYDRPSAADACKKAFLTNRLGDFGFMLGMLVLWSQVGSLRFDELHAALVSDPELRGGWATAAGLLVFCGAVGKSAQFPLHVWLPDAMEGPTPVSALIHAATMVAAGVYLLCRVFFLLNAPALLVIAWVGAVTALIAALIAIQQNDIKRILAYSTLSQLGYMVMAVGLAAPAAAMYHLTTHAFFKALLFLGAGSVIHALHHEQDIWKMGGLKTAMPMTAVTFLVGTLALCGIPPLSGFFSKDSILAAASHTNVALFAVAVFIAALTAFYMVRLVSVAFWGSARAAGAGRAHESPRVMTIPLVALAVPSVLAGFWGVEQAYGRALPGSTAGQAAGWWATFVHPFAHAPLAAGAGLAAAVAGMLLAWRLYAGADRDPLPDRLGVVARWMRDRFYFDELYERLIAWTQDALAQGADFFDRWIVAGLMVRGTHGTTELVGRALRLVQTGNLHTYALLLLAGVAVLVYWLVFR